MSATGTSDLKYFVAQSLLLLSRMASDLMTKPTYIRL